MSSEFVWMRHPVTAGVQKFAKQAAPAWREAGWEPCDPPAAPNLALATRPPRTPQSEPADVPPEPVDVTTTKLTNKNRRPSGATTEE